MTSPTTAQKIRHVLLDFDGLFTLDDYSVVSEALHKSSGIPKEDVEDRLGVHERKWVCSMDPSNQFLKDVAAEFSFNGTPQELADLLNQRGETNLWELLPKLKSAGFAISILSNQIAYRIPHVRTELENRFGIRKFERVYFSPEIGLQKPFAGISERDKHSAMDTTGRDIFPHVVQDLGKMGYSPKELVFFDDSSANIESAGKAGIQGYQTKKVYEVSEQITRILLDRHGIDLEAT